MLRNRDNKCKNSDYMNEILKCVNNMSIEDAKAMLNNDLKVLIKNMHSS